MYDSELPIAGSYTDSGKLRFEADTTPLGKAQAALFGQYSSQNAQEYFDKEYSPLTEKQINTVIESGLSVDEFRKYSDGLKEKNNVGEKVDYIANLPYSNSTKMF